MPPCRDQGKYTGSRPPSEIDHRVFMSLIMSLDKSSTGLYDRMGGELMSQVVEAEIAFGDARITIRGPQEFVQSEVTRLAGLARRSSTGEDPRRPVLDEEGL